MIDDSPVLIKMKANESHYLFCQFSLAINNTILFDKNYNSDALSDEFKKSFDFKSYNSLQERFNQPTEVTNLSIELSVINVKSLLSVVDQIAKALLSDEGDKLKSIIFKKFPGIDQNWDEDFYKSAQYFFEIFKDRFKDNPRFLEVLDAVTAKRS